MCVCTGDCDTHPRIPSHSPNQVRTSSGPDHDDATETAETPLITNRLPKGMEEERIFDKHRQERIAACFY